MVQKGNEREGNFNEYVHLAVLQGKSFWIFLSVFFNIGARQTQWEENWKKPSSLYLVYYFSSKANFSIFKSYQKFQRYLSSLGRGSQEKSKSFQPLFLNDSSQRMMKIAINDGWAKFSALFLLWACVQSRTVKHHCSVGRFDCIEEGFQAKNMGGISLILSLMTLSLLP